MIGAWIKNLKDKNSQKRFEDNYKAAIPILERLQELIDESVESITDKEISSSTYDSPNWDYKQAHINGMKSAFKIVSKLINSRP